MTSIASPNNSSVYSDYDPIFANRLITSSSLEEQFVEDQSVEVSLGEEDSVKQVSDDEQSNEEEAVDKYHVAESVQGSSIEEAEHDDEKESDDNSIEGGALNPEERELFESLKKDATAWAALKQKVEETKTAAPEVVVENQSSESAPFENTYSMASEKTQNRGHLSPKKTKSFLSQTKDSFPEEVASTESETASEESGTNHVSNISTSVSKTDSIHKLHSPMSHVTSTLARPRGGAFAKLIGKQQPEQPDESEFENDGDDELEVKAPVEELIKSREQAVAEFALGSPNNKRYHASSPKKTSEPDGERSSRHTRVLDRDENFHENATSAVVAILTPSNKANSSGPEIANIISADSTDSNMMKAQKASPFARPTKSEMASVKESGSEAVDDAIETMASTGKNPLVQHLLSKKTERHIAAIKVRMKDPTNNLAELIEAIVTPENGLFDRHYMVRRKNACGALKVLAANAGHRVNICWTLGILPALTSVLEDSGPTTLVEKFPNANIRRDFVEARKRALSALMYLAQPKTNKLPIFHCPKLVAGLVRVVEQDAGEARQSSCSVLAQLAKSKENRLIMSQVPGLIDAITPVIEPKKYYFSPSVDTSVFSHSVVSDDSSVEVYDQLSNEIGMSASVKSPAQTMSEEPIMSDEVAEWSDRYDNDPDPFLRGCRTNVFALLIHLVKEKDNEYILARHAYLINTLVAITKLQESSSQDIALKLLANISRHRSNSSVLVFKMKEVVPAIVYAMDSNNEESRKHASYCLQNFSQDKPCRQQLASIDNLLTVVCRSARGAEDPEEKLAALQALKNLTDEPANLIPMSNTPDCFATLIRVAHGNDESVSDMMQYVACDALATLSHWFRSIATSGHRIGMNQENTPGSVEKSKGLFVPSQRVLTWDTWQ